MTDENTLIKVRDCLAKISKGRKTVRGDGLAERISKHIKIPIIEVISVFPKLRKNNELICEQWFKETPLSTVTLNLKQKPKKQSYERWLSAMKNANFSDNETKALSCISEILSELKKNDLEIIAEGFKKLKQDQIGLMNLTKFIVSAQYFLGSSKLLSALPSSALNEFGINDATFSRPASYVIIAGPPDPDVVILVENPQAMETALKENLPNIAWIATFGYGLSKIGSEYGRQLASIIEDSSRTIYPLIRSGMPPSLNELFSNSNIYFWGDLDLEGLKIYTRIKSRLSTLQLSALYNPMLEKLKEPSNNHPYLNLTGKEGQIEWESSDPMINRLIEHCRLRGVDQEILNPSDIKNFAQHEFSIEEWS